VICKRRKRLGLFDEKGEDPRKTYEEWARTEEWAKKSQKPVDAVYEKYAATGRLVCPPVFPTTANLVIKNDVIVTTAHSFYDEKGEARFKTSPYTCKFYVMKKPGDQDPNEIYEVDLSTLEVGKKNGKQFNDRDDWAVAKLKRKVVGVEPYQVDPNAAFPSPDYKGLAVSAGQRDRPARAGDRAIRRQNLTGNGYFDHPDSPNLIHRCKRAGDYGYGQWVTNCSIGDRGSGSALLVDPGKPDPSKPDSGGPLLISAIAVRSPDEQRGYKFDPENRVSSGYAAITGRFRAALLEASK